MALKSVQFSVTTCAFHRRALTAIRTSRAIRCETPGASRCSFPFCECFRACAKRNRIFAAINQSSSVGTMSNLFFDTEETFARVSCVPQGPLRLRSFLEAFDFVADFDAAFLVRREVDEDADDFLRVEV